MVRRNLSHAVERQWVIFEFQKPSLTKAKAKAKCKFYVHDNEIKGLKITLVLRLRLGLNGSTPVIVISK